MERMLPIIKIVEYKPFISIQNRELEVYQIKDFGLEKIFLEIKFKKDKHVT